jgi:branched-chain amino acid transport system ATP-binding protein
MLEIKAVTKRFGGLTALQKVSFTVQQGQIFGLIGPNGAGKTTLLNIIAGVYGPEEGEVDFMGGRITGHRPDQICHEGIARTFQIPKPFLSMSALENVMVAAVFGGRHGRRSPRDVALETLDFVGFPQACETVAGCLNPLQLKRLDLARGLASDPKLLLLDEIAAGLRPSEYRELIDIIRRIRDRGTTILAVEHVLRVVMQVCEQLVVLQYGEKIAEGTPTEIVENQLVIEAYLGKKQVGLAAIKAVREGMS